MIFIDERADEQDQQRLPEHIIAFLMIFIDERLQCIYALLVWLT